MRKPFGIISLIIGIGLIGLGAYDIKRASDLDAENRAKVAQLTQGNPTPYNFGVGKTDKSNFYMAICLGVVLSAVGFFMIRSHKQQATGS